MRILVLGAGAIGGYFGARLMQAGADVTFLVRERRAAQLRERGLVVRSPHGDFTVQPALRLREQLDAAPASDLVLLTCKAYDLDDAIESLRPGVAPHTHIVPLLNGFAHLERLRQAFGATPIAGGTCGIPATLGAQGEVMQLGPLHRIAFGALHGTSPAVQPKLRALLELFKATPVDAELADDIALVMWEKFVGLATLAAMNCLMRGSVADILAADDGPALMREVYAACEGTARAAGHAPREAAMAGFKRMLTDRGSMMTASMLRDLEGGGRTEGAHIIGDMLARVRAAGIDSAALRAAWCHLQAAEHRRQREGR